MNFKYAFLLITATAYGVAAQAMDEKKPRARARSSSFSGPDRAEVLRPRAERPASGHPIIPTTTVDHRK